MCLRATLSVIWGCTHDKFCQGRTGKSDNAKNILIDTNDAAIAKMVIALADTMGLAVSAEGVETQEQRDYLARQGCHAYQGYIFSRPLPIDAFEALVSTDAIAYA
jgi:EAL domain-containing protein (putative c-di-GMP-specific phosphodiesterase class I)